MTKPSTGELGKVATGRHIEEPDSQESREDVLSPERSRHGRSWEVVAVACESIGEKDERRELRQLRQLQQALLPCLPTDEAMTFCYTRVADGSLHWALGLQGATERTANAIHLTLQTLSKSMQFQERNTSEELLSSGAWLEVVPQGRRFTDGRVPMGFCTQQNAEQPHVMELPDLLISGRLSEHLVGVIVDAADLEAIEFTVSAWEASPELREKLERMHEVLARANGGQAVKRLQAWLDALDKGVGYTVRCKVRLGVKSSPDAWARLLGREVFQSAAALEDAQMEQQQGSLAKVMALKSLPLLLPSGSVLRASGVKTNFNRNAFKLPTDGTVAGMVDGKQLRLPVEGRSRHTFILGATGTGKSTMLLNLIREDLESGEGVIVLDPHGDLHEQVLAAVPHSRKDDVVVLDPTSEEAPSCFNLLEIPNDRLRATRAAFVVGEFLGLFDLLFNMHIAGGPMFEMYFRNALMLLMQNGAETKPCLADFPLVFSDKEYRQMLLDACPVSSVKDFWLRVAEKTSGDASLANMTPYLTAKLDGLVNSGFVSKVICRRNSTLHMEKIMNKRGILLVNLSKGLIGAKESRLLGLVLMTQIFSAALGRALLPTAERVPCHLYVDEFQNFVSASVASMMSEARKFGLRLTLANQTLGQLSANHGHQGLLDAVLGNVGNLIAFRLGVRDAEYLGPFTRPFASEQMQRLPNFHAFARVLTAEGPVEPVIMKTLPPK